MPTAQETFEAAQLLAAQEQARAAWAAAHSAEMQAWLTPLSLLVALLAAVAGPYVAEHIQRRRLKQAAADLAALIAGVIGLPSEMAEDRTLWGAVDLDDDLIFFSQAEGALANFPIYQLGSPAVAASLRFLGLHLASAKTAYMAVKLALGKGEPPQELRDLVGNNALLAAVEFQQIEDELGRKGVVPARLRYGEAE